MLVYRISHRDFSQRLYAPGMEGRWNKAGRRVVYCAESIALAFLENMIRRQGVGFNSNFKILIIEIPDDLAIDRIRSRDLKWGWRDFKDYSKCQPLGERWLRQGKTAVLRVPSAVIPQSYNYVINSSHADFQKIKLLQTTDLVPDPRIEEILKKHPSR